MSMPLPGLEHVEPLQAGDFATAGAETTAPDPAEASGTAKAVPAVRRAAAILWLLAARGTPLNLSQIARGVGILPSTALHILRELTDSRLIAFDAGQKMYRLGQGLVKLAQSVIHHDEFAELSRPHLLDIATRFGVTATATAAIDDQHSACVVSITPPGSLSLNVTLGGRVPILSGAAGRCIAAFGAASPAQLQRSFDKIHWRLPLQFNEWMRQVETVRRQGYAEDKGLFALGITTLSAPIFSPDGSITRAIGTATISAALDEDRKAQIAKALVAAATHITQALRSHSTNPAP